MGKSIRSKWCRKMRAIKRTRYAEKELVKLKATVPWYNDGKTTESGKSDKVGERSMLTDESAAASGAEPIETDAMMSDVQKSTVIKKRRKKGPLLDEHGHYPVWTKQRTIKKLQKQTKKAKRVKKRAQRKRVVTNGDGGSFF